MDRDLMLKVVDKIEKTENYKQTIFARRIEEHECKTPGCVASWAIAVAAGAEDPRAASTAEQARELLRLSSDAAARLFRTSWPLYWAERAGLPPLGYERVISGDRFIPTNLEASAVLRKMARCGRVWREKRWFI